MILPIQISFRNMDASGEVENWIREEAAKLDKFYDRIMGCRVVMELPSRRRRNGNLFHVKIDLTLPGGELVVNLEPSLHGTTRQLGQERAGKHLEVHAPHKEIRQAIDDAFKQMGRRLQDFARRQRGDVKSHEPIPGGSLARALS